MLVIPLSKGSLQALDGIEVYKLQEGLVVRSEESFDYYVIPLERGSSHVLEVPEPVVFNPSTYGSFRHIETGVLGQFFGQGVNLHLVSERKERKYFEQGEPITLLVEGAQMSEVKWSGLPESAVFEGNSVSFVVQDHFTIIASVSQFVEFFTTPVEIEGGGTVDGNTIRHSSGPLRTLLRIVAFESGRLNFRLTKPQRILVNGEAFEVKNSGRIPVSKGGTS